MAKMKDLLIDVLDKLTETGMDYELVAEIFGMTPSQVYEIAREYGDVE